MIEKIVERDLCMGCATCVGTCPQSAIDLLIDDSKGVFYPAVNYSKCNNCGFCIKVCPGHKVDFNRLNVEIFKKDIDNIFIGNYINCYTGFSKDFNIRYNSASGGAVTQFLIFLLKQGFIDGALVTRMKKDAPLEPEPFIARTEDDIIEASKSKYCPVPANIMLKEILNSRKEEKFAVVGLPCHIQGIRKAEQKNEELKKKIVMHLGIMCAKTISFLGTKFLLNDRNIDENDVKFIEYRGKGWPGYMTIGLKNGQEITIELSHYYADKFALLSPWRCSLCGDATCELADISFGDAWLPEIKKTDHIGTSIIITRNDLSERILQDAVENGGLEILYIDSEKVNESQRYFNWKKGGLKARFIIAKLINKNVPIYNMPLPEPTLSAFLVGSIYYLKSYLSSRRHLWFILDIYNNIMYKLRQ